MQVYLDVCCLNRPLDDQRQDRIRLEAEAILLILARIEAGSWHWVGSNVVDMEISETPNQIRLARLRMLAGGMTRTVIAESVEYERSRALVALGFQAIDALHLACAERAGVDVFLTVDDRLLRAAVRHSSCLRVLVKNPIAWLQEVLET